MEATEKLVAEGFQVLVYTSDDAVVAKRLKAAGAASVMPAGSPIGSGQGVLNPNAIRICLEYLKDGDPDYPVIVDAGVGTASDVAIAMELGVDGVLLNTGIAHAQDPLADGPGDAAGLRSAGGWLTSRAAFPRSSTPRRAVRWKGRFAEARRPSCAAVHPRRPGVQPPLRCISAGKKWHNSPREAFPLGCQPHRMGRSHSPPPRKGPWVVRRTPYDCLPKRLRTEAWAAEDAGGHLPGTEVPRIAAAHAHRPLTRATTALVTRMKSREFPRMWAPRLCSLLVVTLGVGRGLADDKTADPSAAQKISFYRQVRPIFQAACLGCHQPAKPGGGYVMLSRAALLKGGETGEAAIVPGKPDDSNLLSMITPADGKSDMPKGRPPLAAAEILLIRRWIAEGAADDTPSRAQVHIDARHPPLYARPPVIASLDFAPDGRLLAIAGFHEVLLWKPDGSQRLGRLVGMSDRIESVRFSPDGSRLAAVGGNPCRMGEVQVWNVAAGKLALSLPLTYDTLYGGSWSPDGKLIAFGGADNAVRAIDAATAKPVLFMAAHEDWVRGTAFSRDGKSLFSVSRDMTVKMTELATQRFLGNVTTHTPGILRGGMLAIARHPRRDEILVGGADGVPKLFRMDVKAAPASGGNPNQIREYPPLPGRVFDLGFSPDGARVFAVGTLDGKAQVSCCETDSGKPLWQLDVPETALYALACAPDGNTLAAAGGDGQVRLIDAASGKLRKRFLPVEITPLANAAGEWYAGPELRFRSRLLRRRRYSPSCGWTSSRA